MVPVDGDGAVRRDTLSGIQALRGIAAALVVFSHVAGHVHRALGAPYIMTVFRPGHVGVDLFFVVSGFIILFVHWNDVDRPQRLQRYLDRRFTRVFPLYWIALVLTVAMILAAGHGFPDAPDLLLSATLLPAYREPVLGIAWTLQYEVLFYTVFATLIVNRRLGILLFGLWSALILLALVGTNFAALPPMLYGSFASQFFMGLGAAYIVRRRKVPFAKAVALAGAVLFVAGYCFESAGILNGYAPPARFVYGPAAMLLVAGAASAERAGTSLGLPRWLAILGNATYSIYLFQFVFIGAVWQAWQEIGLPRQAAAPLCFAVLAISAVGGGVLAGRYIEQPILRWARSRRANAARVAQACGDAALSRLAGTPLGTSRPERRGRRGGLAQ